MHTMLQFVFAVVLLGCAQGEYNFDSYGCTPSNVQTCLMPFVAKYGQQNQNALFMGGETDAKKVTEMCSDFTKARVCLDNFMSSCDDSSRKLFEGLYDMYDYICGDGLPLLLHHQECFANPELVTELTTCNETAMVTYQDIQQKMYQYQLQSYFDADPSDIDNLKNQLCDTTKDLIVCMKDSVTEHCGAEATSFVVTVMDKILEPTMEQIDCDYLSENEEEEEVVLTVEEPPARDIWQIGSSQEDSSSSSDSSEEEDTNEQWWLKGAEEERNLAVPSDTMTYACTESHVHECVQPFIERYGLQDQAALFARSVTRDEDAMREVCRDFSSVKKCINGFLRKCDDTSKKIFEGLYDMYDYTCGDGLYLYLAHQQCFARPDLAQALKVCNDTAADSYKHIQDHMAGSYYHSKSDVDKMKKKLCRTTRQLVSCMKESVEDRCGSEAAEFATTVVNKMLAPTMKEVECQKKMSFTTWLAIALAIGLLLIAILAVCMRLYVRNRRLQERRARNHAAIIDEQQFWDDQPVYKGTTTTAALPKPPAYSEIEAKDTEPMLRQDAADQLVPVHTTGMMPSPPPYSFQA